ncbi:hypothetical protein [Actinoplanes sp. NPDC023714]|uniref:hypothetical protein n=1 Tax=Actinoplanes sp. NPDC023714 TaxID=3154322 RepID=UPI00340CDB5C
MNKAIPGVYSSGHAVTRHLIEVYHNLNGRFDSYTDDHVLQEVISHWRYLPAAITEEEVASWAFTVFNADLELLSLRRGEPGGEEDFLIAGVYRMLRRRSLSVGDVVAVSRNGRTVRLACEATGWRRIGGPPRMIGEPLTATAFLRHAWCRDA